MKRTVLLFLVELLVYNFAIAQREKMYIIKGGNVIGKYNIEDIDSIIFYEPTTITDYDNNVYRIVTIGTQRWMAENLRTTKYNDGTSIPNIKEDVNWASLNTPGYCWYNNDSITYSNLYGALYNWHTVNTKKLCPTGWHVPTDIEWTTLTTFLDGLAIAGGKLKEVGITHWQSPNTGATDSVNFKALPGGLRANSATFEGLGIFTFWWSSISYGADAWFRNVYYNNTAIGRDNYDKQFGFYVRCLSD